MELRCRSLSKERGRARCLPWAGIRSRSQVPLGEFLAKNHVGFALELMRFSGITEVEDTETSYDSIKVSMSYADSVFTVVRPDSGVVFSFAPKGEVEVFMSDAAGNFDAYTGAKKRSS